ncbi:hypothetical protein [Amycolatopsis magusensis]|uniref:CxxC-x17-CxxC domain-containing protein n=1 Tax=Amycolatopsis magusensis TaxID=882444 RepID=A0ABS4PL59_9PSEU|nr:hypothetical protein [Amycolatopsis magusensis]MBP2180130.1 CxxC-x17-CxxC domain-containing protein [Amycolatopsis magusensis]
MIDELGSVPAGTVVEFAARDLDIYPSPAVIAEAFSRREGRCVLGRPLYHEGEVPTGILATVPELKRMLLRPRLGQPPIATKKNARRGQDALYAIADAEPMPPATPQVERKRLLQRICAECQATSQLPFQPANDGKYYCEKHKRAADEREERQRIVDDSFRSALWSREILADPDTALVAMTWDRESQGYPFRVETVAGDVVLERVLPYVTGAPLLNATANDLPSWVNDPAGLVIADRRIIEAPSVHAVAAYRKLLGASDLDLRGINIAPRDEDNLARRYHRYANHPDRRHLFDGATRANTASVDWKRSLLTAAQVIEQIRQVLFEMARCPLSPDEVKRAKRLPRVPRSRASRRSVFRDVMLDVLEQNAGLGVRLYHPGASPLTPQE